MKEISGILIVDKPSGWTSHDVVRKTRNMLGGTKVGHTGTLDPGATGLLLLLIGKATKIASRFENDEKRYLAEVTFGRSTDTYDGDGQTTVEGNTDSVNIKRLEAVIRDFAGESEQIPPMYSAVKVKGKRLYRLAREGKTVKRKSRKIFVISIESDLTHYPIINLDIVCSKGTYIRVIAHQIGEEIGCPSYLSALRRIESGKFTINDAVDFRSLIDSPDRDDVINHIRAVPEI